MAFDKLKFIDGSPVPEEYMKRLDALCEAACECEEKVFIDTDTLDLFERDLYYAREKERRNGEGKGTEL